MIRKLNLFFSIFTLVIFSSSTIAADKVVTFLHGETDTESVVAYEKIARDFEKLNPGIKKSLKFLVPLTFFSYFNVSCN